MLKNETYEETRQNANLLFISTIIDFLFFWTELTAPEVSHGSLLALEC